MPLQSKPCLVCAQPIFDTVYQLPARKVCSPACRTALRNSLPVVARRFWPRVEKTDGCWLWTGPVQGNNGYGSFHYLGKLIGAHRFSWILHRGPVVGRANVLHRCDTPTCVNPDHLFLGTHAENMADRNAKGRTARGERIAVSRLTDSQVLEMRRLRGEGMSETALGRLFGVNRSTAHCVVRGKLWRHLPLHPEGPP